MDSLVFPDGTSYPRFAEQIRFLSHFLLVGFRPNAEVFDFPSGVRQQSWPPPRA